MDIKTNEIFWNANMEEVKSGFIEREKEYKCIICEKEFEKGRIYEVRSALYEAKKAIEMHIEDSHGSVLNYLLGMNSTFLGVSDIQKEVISLISEGLSDKEVAEKMGVAQSTVRNHKYKLREKEKQARIFLTMMDLLAENTNRKINKLDKEVICDAHKTATILDDRFNITDKEKMETIKNYMDENGALKSYPAKAKKKVIVLEEIVRNFSKGKIYSEKEINRILKRIYSDYASLRRALIEYGYVERTNDCKSYWVKE
ncbi:DUF2087 domain-containing protein [Clostridium cibarium]|uniref:DUF2087 domain-containing protein n=1 Tax=Clostridium cibarium TaxID=2762247 RepID=A0ABR8PPU2_9CLOT|nr:DUF2087 domain-containing protein [Clostridium cibarium]MBD7910186.1 DUF2087 domain-containing protein [Clostridium cibarium]